MELAEVLIEVFIEILTKIKVQVKIQQLKELKIFNSLKLSIVVTVGILTEINTEILAIGQTVIGYITINQVAKGYTATRQTIKSYTITKQKED